MLDATFIGGDFGGKGLSIDEYVCYFLARATGRPIKAVMNYVDELPYVCEEVLPRLARLGLRQSP